MKTVEFADATAPLSDYALQASKEALVVMRRGKPLAALVPLDSDEWEDFVVSRDPGFIEMMKRSEDRYRAEGGISLEEMRKKYGLARRTSRRRGRKAR